MTVNKSIANRIKKIMEYSGLETLGLSVLIKEDISHIYSILTDKRRLTEDIASKIGEKLGFDGSIIFEVSTPIPKNEIESSSYLNTFKKLNINKNDFFLNTTIRTDHSINSFIENELINSKLFDGKPKDINEIQLFCKKQYNKEYTNLELTKALESIIKVHEMKTGTNMPLIINKVLKSEKQKKKKRDGSFSGRPFDVFYLESNKS